MTQDTLTALFVRLQQGLRQYLHRRLPDATLADDLLQDVFIKALAASQSEQSIDNPGGWLYTITRNTLVDYLRTNPQAHIELDPDMPLEESEDLQLHAELSSCLRPFIDQLPPLYRDTLLATEYDRTPLQELAQRDGVSLSAIKSRAARARSRLRDLLLQCCQVEMENGLVSNYQQKTANACDSGSVYQAVSVASILKS